MCNYKCKNRRLELTYKSNNNSIRKKKTINYVHILMIAKDSYWLHEYPCIQSYKNQFKMFLTKLFFTKYH